MSVLSLALAKTHLNISVSTYDTELQTFIDAAEAAIAKRCGPLAATAVTDRLAGGGGCLILKTCPAISLTSVTPSDGGAALTVGDLYLEPATGIVTYNASRGFSYRYYTVVYSAGRSTVPDDLLLAVKEQVRALWEDSQRGDADRTSGEGYMSNTILGSEFGLSFEVSRLIRPHLQVAIA